MSRVPRGRKSKKVKKGGLLAAQGPRALEQATAELVGAELYDAVRDERSGLRFDLWAVQLVDHAVKRMIDAASRGDDSWPGPWWLLHGLASIGPYGLGGYAWEQASKAAGSLPRDVHAPGPAWLKLLPEVKATGDVRVMRDGYGTRFGVTAAVSYPPVHRMVFGTAWPPAQPRGGRSAGGGVA
jgi:hypothetical protein